MVADEDGRLPHEDYTDDRNRNHRTPPGQQTNNDGSPKHPDATYSDGTPVWENVESKEEDNNPYREESVGEIQSTDDFSENVDQEELEDEEEITSHSGFRDAEKRSRTVKPSHSGFRKAESNPAKEFFADPLPTLDNSDNDVSESSQDDKDEQWYEPFPSAYAEEEPTVPSNKPSNPRTKRSRTHDSNVTYLNEGKQAVSVGGVPLEAKNHTDQTPSWNQRGHRAGQMIGVTPSMGTRNSITDFVEGLAAPVENYGITVKNQFSQKRKTENNQGRRGSSKSVHDAENSPELIPYKETLLDNTISGKEPTRSPAYYWGTAVSDAAMIVAPIPGTRVVLGVKTAVRAATNLKKAKRIAQVTQEEGIIQDIGAATKYTTKEGKSTKITDPARIRIRQDIFMKRMTPNKYNHLSKKDQRIAKDEFQKISKAREIKAKETKIVKQITPDHFIISRGTESNPAKFTTTLIDYGKGGKTKNLKNTVNRDKSPDSIDIRGDVDPYTKKMLDLYEQNNRQFVSTKKVRPDENFVLRKAEETGHLKSWADMDVYSTKDAQYLADTSLTFTKNGVPFMKPPVEIERIYQTLAAGSKPKGKTGGMEIGDVNYDKILVDKGLNPPKQSKRTGSKSSSKKSTEKSYWDAYEENYIESNLTHYRKAQETEKMFESMSKSSYKKKTTKTKAKVDKSAKIATGFGVVVDSAFGTMPPALDHTLNYSVEPKMDSSMKMSVDVGVGTDSLQGFSQDSIAEQGQKLFQDTLTDKKTPQKTGQKTKTNTGQKTTPDVVPVFDEDYIKLTGLRTTGKTGTGLTTFTPTIPITTTIPEIPPDYPSIIFPDMLYGGSPRYGYDNMKAWRDIYMQSGVKDTPFELHNITDFTYSYKPIPDKKKKKSTGKKVTRKSTTKKTKKKEVNSWGF